MWEDLARTMDALRSDGQTVAARHGTLTGKIEARQRERERMDRQRSFVAGTGESSCPTCGTRLTAGHREAAIRRLSDGIAQLSDELKRAEKERAALDAKRTDLRCKYAGQRKKAQALEGARPERAAVDEMLSQAERAGKALGELARQLAQLEERIEAQDFAAEARTQLAGLLKARSKVDFDSEAFGRAQQSAAAVPYLEERERGIRMLGREQLPLRNALEKTRQKRQAEQARLKEGTDFADLEASVAQLPEDAVAVGFDEGRYAAVRSELRRLEGALDRMLALSRALEDRTRYAERLEALQGRLLSSRKERESAQELSESLKARIAAEHGLEGRLEAVRGEGAKLDERLAALLALSGQVGEKLARAESDRRARAAQEKKKLDHQKEAALHRHLAAAFGKHGVPSLIIEETLPHLEDRANRILERLSGGRMHVRIETQKQKQKGGTAETLEIRINDELGRYRAYETYSGGEAFRVNFALRIALAQLLAERSGVRVRMLIIDEGFGTQDAQGVESLIESIHAIKDDFSKILVISHIRDVKNAFPVRIEVEKLPSTGSRFEVMGVEAMPEPMR